MRDKDEPDPIVTVMALSQLRRKPEVDDVPVLHDVFLAFEADLAVIPAGGHGAAADQRLIGHYFSANRAALDLGMDLACSVLCRRPTGNRPRAALVLTDGEEGHIAKQIVGGANYAIKT